MNDTATPASGGHAHDADVIRFIEIVEQIEVLNVELEQVKQRLRDLGPGSHDGPGNVRVLISAPPRRFDSARAWDLLSPEQQALAVSPDAKKIKAQLAPVLAESCMVDGAGAARVSVQ